MVEPFGYGDVLQVRLADGRIERESFIVTSSNTVHGGGYRYNGLFPGHPVLVGRVYSEDVIRKLTTLDVQGVQFWEQKEREQCVITRV